MRFQKSRLGLGRGFPDPLTFLVGDLEVGLKLLRRVVGKKQRKGVAMNRGHTTPFGQPELRATGIWLNFMVLTPGRVRASSPRRRLKADQGEGRYLLTGRCQMLTIAVLAEQYAVGRPGVAPPGHCVSGPWKRDIGDLSSRVGPPFWVEWRREKHDRPQSANHRQVSLAIAVVPDAPPHLASARRTDHALSSVGQFPDQLLDGGAARAPCALHRA